MISFRRIAVLSLLIVFPFTVLGSSEWSDKDAIILNEEIIFRITDTNEGIYSLYIKILIKNEKAAHYGKFYIYENQFIESEDIEVCIKDITGNIIKTLDEDDIIESSISPNYILHSDAKRKLIKLMHNRYPYILEYSFTKKFKSLFFWPDWDPQFNDPVISSSYKLILEKPIKFKTYSIGLDLKPEIYLTNNDTTYLWQIDSLESKSEESHKPPENKIENAILFTPLEFEMDNISGSFNSWDSVAEWYRRLYKNKYDLPDKAKSEINSLITNEQNDKTKIDLLYKYLQNKTRYVAISLGIGGWQPHSASSVYECRYGDCKDLSTLMVSMLNYINIKSYPAIIRTKDSGFVYKEFPSHQFNHVITCVPFKNDTLWLENTADYLDAGEFGWQIEGCNVLLVTDSSGPIVKTPVSSSFDNAWKSKIEGEISPQGNFSFLGTIKCYGNQKNYVWNQFNYRKTKDFEEWLISKIGSGIPGFKLEWYNIDKVNSQGSSYVKLTFKANIRKFGNKTGKRIFINPNILNIRSLTAFENDEERTYPIHFNYAYMEVDTVSIKFPYGYKLEATPGKTNIETDFAKYQSDNLIEGDTFKYFRHFEYKTNSIPADQYDQMVEFTNTAIKKDQSKYVFKKK